jgi:hypothetical protein
MEPVKDWRLTNQERYLMHARLVHRAYGSINSGNANPANDHDHCEFCWAKFTLSGQPDALTTGYATLDGYRWICEQCFRDFVSHFKWEVTSAA